MKAPCVRLKLWQSISLLILASALPMAAITIGVMTVSIEKDVNFGLWEEHGVAFQRPLAELLDAAGRYRFADGLRRAEIARAIDEALDRLDEAAAKYGTALQFTKESLASRGREASAPEALRGEWKALRVGENPAPGVCADFVAHIRGAIAHSGDISNLILDPDLDSYYVMDALLCALPQTQDRIGAILAEVGGWREEGTLAQHAGELAAMRALLAEADLARIAGDVQTALAEDRNFYGESPSLQRNLPPAAKKYAESAGAFAVLLGQLSAGDATVSREAFALSGEAALSSAMGMWKVAADEMDALLAARIDSYRSKRWTSLALIALVLVLSGGLTLVFVRRLQKRLRLVAGKLESSAAQLVEVTGQIAASSQSLAESASREASSLEETASSLEELASMSKSNAESADRVTGSVRDARLAAGEGEGDMKNLADAMDALKQSSADIAKIVRTIDEIAFQTNILALNAAVEAARAGESGAGFAVVADEVRGLAQRSAKAARETSDQIERTIAQAGTGVEISARVVELLRDISERVRGIDQSADEVSAASREQSQGVEQIGRAVADMDRVTQGNAASAEESAAAAAELGGHVAGMEEAVRLLSTIVDGTSPERRLLRPVAARSAAAVAKVSKRPAVLPRPA